VTFPIRWRSLIFLIFFWSISPSWSSCNLSFLLTSTVKSLPSLFGWSIERDSSSNVVIYFSIFFGAMALVFLRGSGIIMFFGFVGEVCRWCAVGLD
jgi:hypothetical protein